MTEIDVVLEALLVDDDLLTAFAHVHPRDGEGLLVLHAQVEVRQLANMTPVVGGGRQENLEQLI